jgi:hypothetical protein
VRFAIQSQHMSGDKAHIAPCVGYLMGIKLMVRDLSRRKAEGQRSSVIGTHGRQDHLSVPIFDEP